jgi:hypothetical protein
MAICIAKAAGGKWSETGTWEEGKVPTAADDVILETTSGNVEISVAAVCRTLDCQTYKGTLTNKSQLTIGTSTAPANKICLRFPVGMTFTPNVGSSIWLKASVGTTLTISASVSLGTLLIKEGKYILAQALTCIGKLEVENPAELKTENRTITANTMEIFGAGKLIAGTSTIKVTESVGTILVIATTAVIEGTPTWELTGGGTGAKTATLGGRTFSTFIVNGDNLTFSQAATFGTLTLNTAGFANGTKFTKGLTYTITTAFTTNAKSGSVAKILSSKAGESFTFSKSSGTISLDFVELKDSHATGGAIWIAGPHSTNVSGNEGWKWEAPSFALEAEGTYAARTSIEVPKPAGLVSKKHYMLLSIYLELTNVPISIEGWKIVGEPIYQENGTAFAFVTFAKLYEGEAGPYIVTWNATSHGCNWRFAAYNNVGSVDPINAVAGAASTTSSVTERAPSVVTTVANCLLVIVGANSLGNGGTPPAGFIERTDNGGYTADGVQVAEGASGNKDVTISPASWNAAQLIALIPEDIVVRLVSQSSGASMQRSVVRSFSATQGSSTTAAPTVLRALAQTQGTTPAASLTVARGLPVAQGQSTSSPLPPNKTVPQALSVSQASTALGSLVVTRALAASDESAATSVKIVTRTTTTTQPQSAAHVIEAGRRLLCSQGSTAEATAALTHMLVATQLQNAGTTLLVGRAFSPTQGQSAAIVLGVARLLLASAPQSSTCTGGFSRTQVAAQGQLAVLALSNARSRAVSVTQPQSTTMRVGVDRSLIATQEASATIVFGRLATVMLSCEQGQSASCSRAPALRLAATQTQSMLAAINITRLLSASASAFTVCRRAPAREMTVQQQQTASATSSTTGTRTLTAAQSSSSLISLAVARTFALEQPQEATMSSAIAERILIAGKLTSSTSSATLGGDVIAASESSSVAADELVSTVGGSQQSSSIAGSDLESKVS